MNRTIFATGALAVALSAGPAFADCKRDIQRFNENYADFLEGPIESNAELQPALQNLRDAAMLLHTHGNEAGCEAVLVTLTYLIDDYHRRNGDEALQAQKTVASGQGTQPATSQARQDQDGDAAAKDKKTHKPDQQEDQQARKDQEVIEAGDAGMARAQLDEAQTSEVRPVQQATKSAEQGEQSAKTDQADQSAEESAGQSQQSGETAEQAEEGAQQEEQQAQQGAESQQEPAQVTTGSQQQGQTQDAEATAGQQPEKQDDTAETDAATAEEGTAQAITADERTQEIAARTVAFSAMEMPVDAAALIGLELRNFDGTALGEVDGVLVSTKGGLTHLIVEHGGFLSLGEKQIAIPVKRLRWDPKEELFYVDVTEDQIGNAPEYERNSDKWVSEINDRWYDDPS